MHLDVTVQRQVRIFEPQVALATAEQGHEDVPEVLPHLRECRQEHLPGGRVDFPDRRLQRVPGVVQVSALAGQEVEPLHFFVVFLDGQWVHRT